MNVWQKIIPIFVILTIIGAGSAGYFYLQYQKAQKEIQTIKTDPSTLQKAAQEETNRLIAQVGKLIELPKGEQPTVATITDIDKLKSQPFFQQAKNGNKVLIYTNAKKAILYDDKTNKIIDVAPINIGTPSAQQAQPEQQARVVIRNGTTVTGLTSKIEDTIKKAFPQVDITGKDNSVKTDYDKTVVVYLNDQAKGAADSLAKSLNVESVNSLPQGEPKPQNTDILILVGKDKAQ